MFESKEEKKRKATRERVQRYRKNKAVIQALQPVVPSVTDTKMICKCTYYKIVDGQLVCSNCGKPASKKKIEDKVVKDLETK